MSPAYEFERLIQACLDGSCVILKPAQQDAKQDLDLKTEKAIRAFIAGGGLEKPTFIRSRAWQNNPDKTKEILVDSYSFYSGRVFGYVAFFYASTHRFVIKSLKRNTEPDPRTFTLRQELEKLGPKLNVIRTQEKEDGHE